MRRQEIQVRNRRALPWYAVGFVAVQIALGMAADCYWPGVRDPDFEDLKEIVQQRQAEMPGRPLVLFFGSSRMKSALRAERLNHPEDPAAPLVINAAVSGSGPMLHDVYLRRWLNAGIRPDLIFLEILPMSLSIQDGAAIEEYKNGERYCAAEAVHIWPYYAQPIRLCWRWAIARACPAHHNQAELREALAIDVRAAGKFKRASGRDDYGWLRGSAAKPPEVMQRALEANLDFYHPALTQPAVAPGAMQAMRSVITLALKERITIVLVVPPESSAFRSYCPGATASQVNAVRGLADDLGVTLLDHSAWIDDEGFWDGHHPTVPGANQYTQRFAKEVFEPMAASIFLYSFSARTAPRGR